MSNCNSLSETAPYVSWSSETWTHVLSQPLAGSPHKPMNWRIRSKPERVSVVYSKECQLRQETNQENVQLFCLLFIMWYFRGEQTKGPIQVLPWLELNASITLVMGLIQWEYHSKSRCNKMEINGSEPWYPKACLVLYSMCLLFHYILFFMHKQHLRCDWEARKSCY